MADVVEGVLDSWHGMNVLFVDFVKLPVVKGEPQCAVFFLRKYDRSSPWDFRWLYKVSAEDVLDLCPDGFPLV